MTDGQAPLKAPPGTLERRVQDLEAIVAALVAERGGVEAMSVDVEGPWPKPPPPPPPPPGGGDDGNQTGG